MEEIFRVSYSTFPEVASHGFSFLTASFLPIPDGAMNLGALIPLGEIPH